jgi:hypothetical protein
MLTTAIFQPDPQKACKIPSISTASATYWADRAGTIYTSLNYRSTNVEHSLTKVYTLFDATNRRYIVASDESGCTNIQPVAQLIAEVFLPKPSPGQVLRFIDGDRGNCAASNLVWE